MLDATPGSASANSSSAGGVVRPCAMCGVTVSRRFSQLRTRRRVFCGRICYETSKVGRPAHNRGRKIVATKPCEQCGLVLAGQPALIQRRRFCSSACSGVYFSGSQAPAWRGGASDARKRLFNSSDYRAWRLAVLGRDGGRCRWCDSEGVRTYRPLEIHHIIPASVAPDRLFDVTNGITLCKRHHDLTRGREAVYARILSMLLGQPVTTAAASSNPTRQPFLTSAAELDRLYWREGLTAVEIGERFGVTDACVLKHMQRHGINRRIGGRRAA